MSPTNRRGDLYQRGKPVRPRTSDKEVISTLLNALRSLKTVSENRIPYWPHVAAAEGAIKIAQEHISRGKR